MSDHPFENTYELSNEQLLKLEEAEEEMLRNNLGKAEDILTKMLEDDEEGDDEGEESSSDGPASSDN